MKLLFGRFVRIMLTVFIKLLSSLFFLWRVLGVAISQPTKRSASSTDNTFTGLFDKSAVAVCFLCSGWISNEED